MKRVDVSLERGDYAALSTVPIQIYLSERQAAIVLGVFALALERSAWGEMSDSAWDALAGDLADIASELLKP